MTPLERLESGMISFTKAEAAAASYFIEHPHDALENTVAGAAEKAGLSKTAIMRMCQRVGYSGYAEFRFSMGKYLSSEAKEPKTDKDSAASSTVRRLADAYGSYMRRVGDLMDYDQLADMARSIISARRISIWGVNRTNESVMQLSNRLMRLGIFNQATGDIITMADIARILGAHDLCIVVSMNGRGTTYAPLMDAMRARGAEVFLITMNPDLNLIEHSTQAVILPWISRDYELGTLEDQILVFMYLDILLDKVAHDLDRRSRA